MIKKGLKINKICPYCGEEFLTWRARPGVSCRKSECRSAHKKAHPPKQTERICRECNKKFYGITSSKYCIDCREKAIAKKKRAAENKRIIAEKRNHQRGLKSQQVRREQSEIDYKCTYNPNIDREQEYNIIVVDGITVRY